MVFKFILLVFAHTLISSKVSLRALVNKNFEFSLHFIDVSEYESKVSALIFILFFLK